MSNVWHLTNNDAQLANLIGNLDRVFALQGEKITQDSISDVIKIEHNNIYYYVKRYSSAGKGLKRFFGKPRVRGEWENLQWFSQFGIPTADIVAYGLEKKWGFFKRGAVITQEIPNTKNLADLATERRLLNNLTVKTISEQLAECTRILHAHGFIHNDLKWRNVLVDNQNKVYLIDCPVGDFWRGQLLSYRMIKDLKTLDNHAKKYLTRTQRLRFFLTYIGGQKLTAESKLFLLRLLTRRSRRYDKQSNLSLLFTKRY